MVIVLLAAQRSGAGKTTLAVNLAVGAGNAMVIDFDPSGPAVEWSRRRGKSWPVLVGVNEDLFLDTLDFAQSNRIDWVFVDTPTHASADLLSFVLQYATMTLIPSRPGLLDVCAAGSTARLVRGEGANGVMVFNGIPPQTGRMTEGLIREAMIEANRYGLPVCDRMVAQRADLQKSLITGEGVMEASPDSKAANEIRSLLAWLEDECFGYGGNPTSVSARVPL